MPQTTMQERIWVEQILLLQKQLPVIITTSCLASLLVAIGLSRYLNSTQLMIWGATTLLVALIRLVHMRYWQKITTTTDNVHNQIQQFAFFSGVSGSLWGIFGIISTSQNDPLVSLIAIMVLTGMVASATASLSHFRLAYFSFVLPALVPSAVMLLFLSEPLYNWIAVLIFLYLTVSFKFSKDIRATLIQSITLRFENNALVGSLQKEKSHAIDSMQFAKSANSAKSSFLAAASHDLRQPLCALRLYTATLQLLDNNDKQAEIAKSIDKSVTALEELFDSLLDISKLDAGTLQVEKENLCLESIFKRIAVDFSAIAHEKNIEFDMQTAPYVVYSDSQLLERLLRNLISNAVRYTDKGYVQVRVVETANSVAIRVCDTGCGISVHDQTRIFEEFIQLNNPERDRSKGIGLGLSIVKRSSELIGISVGVESTLGEGSIFSLTVPLGDEQQPATTELAPNDSDRDLENLFVLVIDDEVAIQDSLRCILEKWGCTVLLAGSADEAFEGLADYDSPPDTAIVDLRLRSGENGLHVVEAISSAFDNPVPSLILTGDIDAEKLKEVQASLVPYMHKPCDVNALYSFLHSVFTNTGAYKCTATLPKWPYSDDIGKAS